ncbi:MSC_0620 family F1-like ATPase-associated subunit [Mycoplasma bradburyae]|uniref:Transmembrane protein n=1 Tax=Mycoplasma bradburyae TaxID=2963128 RepID=A0ABT5GBL0_9MOLU|nr:hypothetical protein [Mycoplasma bradburyae]MDC4181791.1 hypothetical protein [Mycoplasma bradburyae]UTS70091.1 hypothetical protein NMG68_03645 [Mycoplasma bradburyae]
MKNKTNLKRLIYLKFGLLVPTLFVSTLGGVVSNNTKPIDFNLIKHDITLDPNVPTIPNPDDVVEKQPGSENADNPQEQPRMPANLEELKKSIDQKISGKIGEFIDGLAKAIEDRINAVKNNTSFSFQEKFNRNLYYSLVQAFFQSNKEMIKSDPSKYGLDIVFPYVLSNDATFHKGTIVFNNKTYDNKIWGSVANKTDYKKQITGEGNSITPDSDASKATVNNTTSQEEGDMTLKTYFDALSKETSKIFFNDDDLPEVDKDYEVTGKVVDSKGGVFSDAPKNFKSWDEYIISKIRPRFIDFDLEQNKDPAQQEEMNQQQPPAVENILPPSVPVDGEPVPTNPKELIENIPRYTPKVRGLYSTLSASAFLNRFNSFNRNNKSSNFFYFENPINTRFKYEVTGLSMDNRSLSATVKIQDAVKPEVTATYTKKLDTINLSGDLQKINENKELAYPVIQETFLRFYKSVGLDAKLNYGDATKLYVEPQTIFQMVYLAMKSIEKREFKNDFNIILSRSIGFSAEQATSYFLNFLRNQVVNRQFLYWQQISEMYKRIFVAFIRDFNKEELKPKLLELLKENKVTPDKFNQSFAEARRRLLKLDSLAKQTLGSPINHFNNLVTEIIQLNNILKPFNLVYDKISDQNKNNADGEKDLTAALKSFSRDIDNILIDSKARTNPFLIILVIFLALISISLYGFYFMQLAFNKTRQINKLNKPLIITVLTIASIALVSTLLIALKIIGVF